MTATAESQMQDRVTIPLAELCTGVTLPAPIYDARNLDLLLLADGTVLTERAVEQLRARGVAEVSLDRSHLAAVCGEQPPPQKSVPSVRSGLEPFCATTSAEIGERRNELQTEIRALYEEVRATGDFSLAQAQGIVRDVVHAMSDRWDLCLRLTCRESEATDVAAHILRLTELSMALAMTVGLPNESVVDLGLGCVLSDIGRNTNTAHLAEQPRQLSASEFVDIQKAPTRTFEMLCRRTELNVGARMAAFQIHERWNGSGYPRGKSGNRIHSLARISSLCNAFVAMTATRPHRPAFRPYDAVKVLVKETAEGLFDPKSFRGLLASISLFPIGSIVRLSDRKRGVVAYPNGHEFTRPIIEIATSEKPQGNGQLVDLASEAALEIVDVVSEASADAEHVESSTSHAAIGLPTA